MSKKASFDGIQRQFAFCENIKNQFKEIAVEHRKLT
jgi:hypothetical protein